MRPELLQAVCFDIGGTLVQMPRGTLARELSVLLGLDQPTVREALRAHGYCQATSPEALAMAIAEACDRAEVAEDIVRVLRHRRADARHPALHEGAEEVLTTLTKRGWRLFYLSNAVGFIDPGPHPRYFSYAEVVLHSWRIGRCAPDPTAYQAITDYACLPGFSIVHIGDSWDTDVMGALAVGWQAVHVVREPGDRDAQRHPDVPRIRVLSEVLDLLPRRPARMPAHREESRL